MKKSLLEVEVVSRCPAQRFPDESYISWARLAWIQTCPGQVAIALVDSGQMQRLNHRFRGIDRPTDVLSFPADPDPHTGLSCLGDVAICEDIVAQKAVDCHKTFAEKTAHTVVHAMLHLQGYRHENEEDASRMHALERELLASVDIGDPYLMG